VKREGKGGRPYKKESWCLRTGKKKRALFSAGEPVSDTPVLGGKGDYCKKWRGDSMLQGGGLTIGRRENLRFRKEPVEQIKRTLGKTLFAGAVALRP